MENVHPQQESLQPLHELLEMTIDAANGFNEAAEITELPRMQELFHRLSTERREQAEIFRRILSYNGEKPQTNGSFAAHLHRLWMDVRTLANAGDVYAVLLEIERGEEVLKEALEEVITQTFPGAVNEVVQEQYSQVKADGRQLKSLREYYENQL